MKTKNFQFTDKELTLLRRVLSHHVADLRFDEMMFVRSALSAKSIHKELLFANSIMSKLNNC